MIGHNTYVRVYLYIKSSYYIYRLTISLCPHCFGTCTVNFSLEDIPPNEDIMPSRATYSIDINVLSANDPPVINAFSKNGTVILHNDPTEPILVSNK